jgi:BirA family transcriptional regulator, biotin operon repressor / biotin---[acetyl-CoA-carboxylase] ligase
MLSGTGWPEPRWAASTESTNTDALAALPTAEGSVFGADEQRAGRGRLARAWLSEPEAGVWFSLVVNPTPGPLALAIAVGVARGLEPWVQAQLKWPNDILVAEKKLGGILIEVGRQTVVGIGINAMTPPIDGAVGMTDVSTQPWTRESILAAVLRGVHDVLGEFRSAPQAVLAEYRTRCITIGRLVRVSLPDGSQLLGIADVDDKGQLVVEVEGITHTVAAGDVVHATI